MEHGKFQMEYHKSLSRLSVVVAPVVEQQVITLQVVVVAAARMCREQFLLHQVRQ
jgi:hypothetical protein